MVEPSPNVLAQHTRRRLTNWQKRARQREPCLCASGNLWGDGFNDLISHLEGAGLHTGLVEPSLSHSLKASDRHRKIPKSGRNRLESLCAGLWAPCRVFWAWFGFALGPNPIQNRRFPAGSLKVFGALLAQPSNCLEGNGRLQAPGTKRAQLKVYVGPVELARAPLTRT